MADTRLILACDFGTSALTACHTQFSSSIDDKGRKIWNPNAVYNVDDWPGADVSHATGIPFLPTDLVFSRESKQLIFWGFEAQEYLTSISPEIPFEDVFIVENIKLLLPDRGSVQNASPASERYQAERKLLIETLQKQPEQVFEEGITEVFNHVVKTMKADIYSGVDNQHLELVLAFPAGWPDSVHSNIAKTARRAMTRALIRNSTENVQFDLRDVYTVSETVCGTKEWLRRTLGDLEVGPKGFEICDDFLSVDIGGGTTCITPMKLLSKNPPAVEQLDKTQSLYLSGESVDAEFQAWAKPQITSKYYNGDIPQLLDKLRRQFKDHKKFCGQPSSTGSSTWTIPVPDLQPNWKLGWTKGIMRFKREDLAKLFDPMIDALQEEIRRVLEKFPSIKIVVFLGQFGGRSRYLHDRMADSDIGRRAKICHSRFGKLDVLTGAISERLNPDESFVRQYRCSKGYGTLITLPYNETIRRAFPNPKQNRAVPFVKDGGLRLKVIEWAIPKGTVIHNGRSEDIGRDSERQHTWPFKEKDIGFTDTIVVSDEDPTYVELDGMRYTMWTIDHEEDKLYHNGERLRVRQIYFGWDLTMSQRQDAPGPYREDDLGYFWDPPLKVKKHRRKKLRELWYDLIWDITEMQVKVHVRARFPNQIGPATLQLAQERTFEGDEKLEISESRSAAIERDIQLTYPSPPEESNQIGVSQDVSDAEENFLNLMFPDLPPPGAYKSPYLRTYAGESVMETMDEDKVCHCRTTFDPPTGRIEESFCTVHSIQGSPEKHMGIISDPTRQQPVMINLDMIGKGDSREMPSSWNGTEDRSMQLWMDAEAVLDTASPSLTETASMNRNFQYPPSMDRNDQCQSMNKSYSSPLKRGNFTAIRGGKRGKKMRLTGRIEKRM